MCFMFWILYMVVLTVQSWKYKVLVSYAKILKFKFLPNPFHDKCKNV